MENQRVKVSGVVTGDFQDSDGDETRNLGGFFLQENTPDGDVETSDGVFVFDRHAAFVNVERFDQVEVVGSVTERFGETQIVAENVEILGEGSVEQVMLHFPSDSIVNSDDLPIADLEHVEGMLVELAEPAVVSGVFGLERFGEIAISANGRLQQFTNANEPDVGRYADHREQNARRSIILDDGLTAQNPKFIRYRHFTGPDGVELSIRSGDSVAVVGNVRFSRGSGASGRESFRLVPATDPVFSSVNRPSDDVPDVGGSIHVASFNVLNFFSTIDNGQDICGPTGNSGCRGADSRLELTRQKAKVVNTLLQIDADVVGLMELENNGGVALRNIVDEMNLTSAAGTWSYVDSGVIGTDAIAVGLLYKLASVRPAGRFAVLTSDVDARFDDRKNRPVLAQSFDSIIDGQRITVVVNHLKSKGSDCDDVADPNRNDGQGNCSQTRAQAAVALAEWLATDPTDSRDPDILIIGDLNSYLQEDTVRILEQAGYVNLLERFVGVSAYSFVFDSQAGALDHALASPSLATRVSGAAEWHINADESPLYDYNLEFGRDETLFDAADPARTSDHDPIIVGIDP